MSVDPVVNTELKDKEEMDVFCSSSLLRRF